MSSIEEFACTVRWYRARRRVGGGRTSSANIVVFAFVTVAGGKSIPVAHVVILSYTSYLLVSYVSPMGLVSFLLVSR